MVFSFFSLIGCGRKQLRLSPLGTGNPMREGWVSHRLPACGPAPGPARSLTASINKCTWEEGGTSWTRNWKPRAQMTWTRILPLGGSQFELGWKGGLFHVQVRHQAPWGSPTWFQRSPDGCEQQHPPHLSPKHHFKDRPTDQDGSWCRSGGTELKIRGHHMLPAVKGPVL